MTIGAVVFRDRSPTSWCTRGGKAQARPCSAPHGSRPTPVSHPPPCLGRAQQLGALPEYHTRPGRRLRFQSERPGLLRGFPSAFNRSRRLPRGSASAALEVSSLVRVVVVGRGDGAGGVAAIARPVRQRVLVVRRPRRPCKGVGSLICQSAFWVLDLARVFMSPLAPSHSISIVLNREKSASQIRMRAYGSSACQKSEPLRWDAMTMKREQLRSPCLKRTKSLGRCSVTGAAADAW